MWKEIQKCKDPNEKKNGITIIIANKNYFIINLISNLDPQS